MMDELQGLLAYPDEWLADPLDISLLTAVEEMRSWLECDRPYDRQHHADAWRSVLEDFTYAAARTGPCLGEVIDNSLQRAKDSLAGLIGSSGELNLHVKDIARVPLAALHLHLGKPDAIAAVWDELCSSCDSFDQDFESVLANRDLLLSLFRLTGRDPRKSTQLLAGVLRDSRSDVDAARVLLDGATQGPQGRSVEDVCALFGPTGLTDQERLTLCRQLVSMPPQPAHHVVWFAVSGLPFNPPPSIGQQITFHATNWLRVLRSAEDRTGIGLPPELINEDSMVRVEDLPGGDQAQLARVDLGKGCWADVEAVALRLLNEAFSGLSFFGSSALLQVRRSEGYLHVRDGVHASRRYRPSFRPDASSTNHAANRATDLLSRLEQSGAEFADVRDDLVMRATEAMDDRLALSQAQNIVERRFRALQIRRTAKGTDRYGWYSYCVEFMESGWVHARLTRDLCDTANRILYGRAPEDAEACQQLLDIRNRVVRHRAYAPRGSLDRAAFIAALPTVVACASPDPHAARQLHTLARRFASATDIDQWVKHTRLRFRLGVKRFRRIRNAQQHGGPAALPAATNSVRELAFWLADTALELTIGTASGDSSPTTNHRAYKAQTRKWARSLVTATQPDQVEWL